MCRTDLDRLIEQSPTIPDSVINACRSEFLQYPKVRKPEIVGDIDTTSIFVDTNSRLKEIAKDAAITLQQKKGILKQIVLDDLEPRIARVIENSTLPAVREELRKEVQKAAEKATKDAVAAVAASRVTATTATGTTGQAVLVPAVLGATVEKQAAERKQEVQSLAMTGVVSEMRRKLAAANLQTGPAPPGIGTLFANLPGTVETPDIVIHITDDATPLQMPESTIGEGDSSSDEDEDEDKESSDEEETPSTNTSAKM